LSWLKLLINRYCCN